MQPAELEQAIRAVVPLLDAETVLTRIGYKLDSLRQNGIELRTFCPIHKEELIRSLCIDTSQRTFRCGYNRCPGSRGGNLFDLYVLATGKARDEAVKEWQTFLGIGPVRSAASETGGEEESPEPVPEETAPEQSSARETESTQPAAEAAEPSPPAFTDDGETVPIEAIESGEFDITADAALVRPDEAPAEPDAGRSLLEDVTFELDADPVATRGTSDLLSGLSDAIEGLDDDGESPTTGGSTSTNPAPVKFESCLSQAAEALADGHCDEAIASAREALTMAISGEDKARTRLLMGKSHAVAGRYTQAQKELRSGLDAVGLREATDHELRYQLGLVLEARKDYRSALATFKNLLADAGEYRDSHKIVERIERAIANLPTASNSRVSFV